MNLTECTGTRGNTRLREHKSKVINLSCSPSELSQCQQGLCRKCTQPSLPCLRNAVPEPLRAGKAAVLGLPREHILQFASPSTTLGPDLQPSLFRLLKSRESSLQPPEQQGMGPAVSHTQFPLPALLPQIRNPLGFQHVLNPLFPPGMQSLFLQLFSFLKKIQVLHTQSQLDKSKSCSFSWNFGVLFSACSPQTPDLTQRKGGTGYVMAPGLFSPHHSTVKLFQFCFYPVQISALSCDDSRKFHITTSLCTSIGCSRLVWVGKKPFSI